MTLAQLVGLTRGGRPKDVSEKRKPITAEDYRRLKERPLFRAGVVNVA